MLSRFTTTAATSLARVASRSAVRPMAVRSFSGEEVTTAADASALSGYSDIDFVISEDAPVIDAIQKFAAYNIGCLVTTDDSGKKERKKPHKRDGSDSHVPTRRRFALLLSSVAVT